MKGIEGIPLPTRMTRRMGMTGTKRMGMMGTMKTRSARRTVMMRSGASGARRTVIITRRERKTESNSGMELKQFENCGGQSHRIAR